jgi:hypothetical protein
MPEQSSAGAAVPPEFTPGVRLMGLCTQSAPPWKGEAALPLTPYKRTPALLLRTFEQEIVKPLVTVALGQPSASIAGRHPRLLSFAVQ